jgi:hypothetical protein
MSVATVSYLFPPPERSTSPHPGPQASKRDTKAIGDRSEAAVLYHLAHRGYLVSIPFGENHRYDLIADDGERLLRIQVKTGRIRHGAILFNCCSTHGHRRSGSLSIRPYFGEIDYLAVYCPENGKTYIIPEKDLVRTIGSLRLAPTGNRQGRRIRWAAKYELP